MIATIEASRVKCNCDEFRADDPCPYCHGVGYIDITQIAQPHNLFLSMAVTGFLALAALLGLAMVVWRAL